jgi:ureidoglycolate dehydrogenase (NAD+)
MTQTDKGVIPYGGRQPFLGTNPLCFGFPTAKGVPVVLDMATSTVAGGKIHNARIENREIPPDWALDSEGNPTTDPHKAVYWTPAGGPKGSGLSIVVDMLTGILCGGAFSALVPTMYGNYHQKRDLCHLVAAVDYGRFAGRNSFQDLASQLVADLHRIQPADGFDGVLAPGEREYLCEAERKKSGIPIEDSVYEGLFKMIPPAPIS